MNYLTRLTILVCCIGLFSCSPREWPDTPIQVYVGWSAGGSSDVMTRALLREMEKTLGVKILVTNITGANGSIAAAQIAAAAPDGSHWLGGAAVHGTWPILGHSDVTWTDFYAFLSVVMPTTLYVRTDAPWKTLEELIADIQALPEGRLKYGHPGTGSNGYIFAEHLLGAAGLAGRARSIPYNGGREAGRYLLSGDVHFVAVTMADLADWATAGRVRPLANLFAEELTFEGIRYPAVTDFYPALKPYQAINPYNGIYLHRDTPDAIVVKVAEAFVYAVQQEGFHQMAVTERAAILSPKLGRDSDEQMSKVESARGWALFRLGVAPHNPADYGVPELEHWRWPPHERAATLKPWPQPVEAISQELN